MRIFWKREIFKPSGADISCLGAIIDVYRIVCCGGEWFWFMEIFFMMQ
jgi:hypothetical protein